MWGATVEVADLPEVEGNSVLLHQLFQNLVGNALTYGKPDVPPQIEVWSEVDSRQGLWRISIADNGIGFEQSRAERIFEPFARLVHSQEFAG